MRRFLLKKKHEEKRDRESNKKSYRKRKEKARAIEEAAKAGDPEALKEYEKILEERRKEAERAKKWRDKQKNKASGAYLRNRTEALVPKPGHFCHCLKIMLAQRQGEGKIKGRCDA